MFLLGTLLNASAQVPSYVPKDSLKGWWPFSGNANDASGNGNNGTVNGATLSADRFGYNNSSYQLDGISNLINLNTLLPSKFSISIWVQIKNFKSYSGLGSQIIGTYNNNVAPSGFVCGTNGNPSLFGQHWASLWNPNNNYPTVISNDSLKVDVWKNLIATYDGTDLKYYSNGSFAGSVKANYIANSRPIFVGAREFLNAGPSFFLNAKVDDIGVWNRALTQQEISNLYNGNICIKSISVTDTLIINVKRTSYNPLAYTNTIKVYPNPTKDKITIDNGDITKMTGYSIKIYNSIGQQLFQSNINQQQYTLDITQWGGNGLYFMELKDNNGNIIDIKKIVLQ